MTLKKVSSLWLLFAAVALAGCPDEPEDELPPLPSNEPAPSASAATLEPANPNANGRITPRIKQELDGRKPGEAKGIRVSVKGTAVSFTAAIGWKGSDRNGYRLATAPDGKARFAAGAYGAGEDPANGLEDAAAALGLSGCEWASPESASVGSDGLPAGVADGLCQRDGVEVKAGYATFSGEDSRVISMGAWDEGGDDAGLFETFRTVTKRNGGGVNPIAACCSVLLQNAEAAPPEQKGGYLAAAGACRQVVNDPRGRAALAQVRALLSGLEIPNTCR